MQHVNASLGRQRGEGLRLLVVCSLFVNQDVGGRWDIAIARLIGDIVIARINDGGYGDGMNVRL